MLENLIMNDSMYLILIIYAGYLLGRLTDIAVEWVNEKIKEKNNNEQESQKCNS